MPDGTGVKDGDGASEVEALTPATFASKNWWKVSAPMSRDGGT